MTNTMINLALVAVFLIAAYLIGDTLHGIFANIHIGR